MDNKSIQKYACAAFIYSPDIKSHKLMDYHLHLFHNYNNVKLLSCSVLMMIDHYESRKQMMWIYEQTISCPK